MAKLEECVRSIQMDGLIWGQCKGATQCTTVVKTDGSITGCRCDDDLTHHLSAEHEMKLYDLKPLQRIDIQVKLTRYKVLLTVID